MEHSEVKAVKRGFKCRNAQGKELGLKLGKMLQYSEQVACVERKREYN